MQSETVKQIQSPAPSGARDDSLNELIRAEPKSKGHREAVWDFAQAFKGLPQHAGKSAQELLPDVERWHAKWGTSLGAKWFDDTRMRFLEVWSAIKHPVTMEEILKRASNAPDFPAALKYDKPQTRLLLKMCRELQRVHAETPFALDCRTAGKFAGMDHDTAGKTLRMFIAEGLLKLESKGVRGRASEYRYLGGL
jgi:hypothetical protein